MINKVKICPVHCDYRLIDLCINPILLLCVQLLLILTNNLLCRRSPQANPMETHHGIRTEHNRTPNQLLIFGALQLQQSGLVAMDFFEQVAEDYGVVEDGLATDESSTEGVSIPRSTVELSEK